MYCIWGNWVIFKISACLCMLKNSQLSSCFHEVKFRYKVTYYFQVLRYTMEIQWTLWEPYTEEVILCCFSTPSKTWSDEIVLYCLSCMYVLLEGCEDVCVLCSSVFEVIHCSLLCGMKLIFSLNCCKTAWNNFLWWIMKESCGTMKWYYTFVFPISWECLEHDNVLWINSYKHMLYYSL
jgi:hypothetical protein